MCVCVHLSQSDGFFEVCVCERRCAKSDLKGGHNTFHRNIQTVCVRDFLFVFVCAKKNNYTVCVHLIVQNIFITFLL